MSNSRTFWCLLWAVLIVLFSGPSSAALDIPTLTWERGKTHDIVLGGYAKNLDWRLSLVSAENGSKSELQFKKSRSNDSNFFVYSLELPREIQLGEYFVVARGEDGTESTVAVVQTVSRFQYKIIEIPRDLLFIFFGLILFLSIQLTVRFWPRYKFFSVQPQLGNMKSFNHSLIMGLIIQRRSWQERWLGIDSFAEGRNGLGPTFEAAFPFLALILGTYAGFNQSLIAIDENPQIFLLFLLSVLAFLDPYSGKLIVLAYSSIFVLFNDLMNFPAILNLTLVMSLFIAPRYVSDVTREFTKISRLHRFNNVSSLMKSFLPSFSAGLSVFWIYLVSESVILSGVTNATKVIPIAIGVAIASLYLDQFGLKEAAVDSVKPTNRIWVVSPVVRFTTAVPLVILSLGVTYIWTDNLVAGSLITFLTFGTLISVYISPNSRRGNYLTNSNRPVLYIALLILVTILIVYIMARTPEVTAYRSLNTLIFGSVPLFVYAIWSLYSQTPRRSPLSSEQRYEETNFQDFEVSS